MLRELAKLAEFVSFLCDTTILSLSFALPLAILASANFKAPDGNQTKYCF